MQEDVEFNNRLEKRREYERENERRELESHAELIAEFKEHCAQMGIILTDEHFSYVTTIAGIVATYPNLVNHLCPESSKDKDGLSDFGALTANYRKHPICAGYLFGENFTLMAHPYFRRGYHHLNNFAPSFLNHFWALDNPAIKTKLAIDYNRVRVNVDDRLYFERDAWYGPQFNQDIALIADGTVRHKPPVWLSEERIRFHLNSIYALDIKWNTVGSVKTFQAEEFKTDDVTINIDGETYFPTRYLHAEFDLEQKCFRHFDGALHFYNLDEYCDRRDSDFNYNAKHSKQIKSASKKLFRLDGVFGVDLWRELTSHFLTGNPLVHEYFTGRMPEPYEHILNILRQHMDED